MGCQAAKPKKDVKALGTRLPIMAHVGELRIPVLGKIGDEESDQAHMLISKDQKGALNVREIAWPHYDELPD